MMDLRPVGYVVGLVILVLGVLMGIPTAVDFALANGNGPTFAEAAIITLTTGGLIALACQSSTHGAMSIRQAFLLTICIWVFVPMAGALPLMLGAPRLGFVDAYFEAVSGITTTGSTVIAGLDTLPAGMNLWRGMLNWLGGLGIAFVAMIFLPVMRVGGMQFFRTEGFDTLGKVLPRATDIARSLLMVYAGLTLSAMTVYSALGLAPLDAVVNAMSSIATGGFAATDQSFSKYQGAAEYAGAFFMIVASLPYIRYVQLVNGNARPLWRDSQARAYLAWIAAAVGTVTLWRVLASDQGPESAFREALFNLSSIFSGTGYFSGSFGSWGGYAQIVALVVGLIGGCSSSSSGALTVFRVQVMSRAILAQIRLIHSPRRIAPIKYEGRTVDDDVMNPLIMYVYSYILTIGVMSVLMTFSGVDIESAVFGIWSSIGNIGYGYGPMLAPTGTYIDFPASAKIIMTVTMLMGRLALLAMFVVVLPRFWRA